MCLWPRRDVISRRYNYPGMDSAYGAVKQNVEITEGETPIFKQLDIDVID